MDDIIEVKELSYAGAELDCHKIGILLRNPNRNTKPECGMRLGQIKKLRQQRKQ